MKDVKFKVAIGVIVILTLALLTVVVIAPSFQGYVINKQIESQQAAVNTIIQQVNQQGYIVLSNDEQTVVLARNQQLEQQLQESEQGQNPTNLG